MGTCQFLLGCKRKHLQSSRKWIANKKIIQFKSAMNSILNRQIVHKFGCSCLVKKHQKTSNSSRDCDCEYTVESVEITREQDFDNKISIGEGRLDENQPEVDDCPMHLCNA